SGRRFDKDFSYQASFSIRNIRRNGSAAPHNNWSPTVKAERYCGPMFILRRRPTGIDKVPVTAVGVKSRRLASRSFGTTLAHWLASASIDSISAMGTSLFNL